MKPVIIRRARRPAKEDLVWLALADTAARPLTRGQRTVRFPAATAGGESVPAPFATQKRFMLRRK